MKNTKFLLMVATVGLALSSGLSHAQEHDSSPAPVAASPEQVEAAKQGVKNFFGGVLNFGTSAANVATSAVNAVVQSEPVRGVTKAATETYKQATDTDIGRQATGAVRTVTDQAGNVYRQVSANEPVQTITDKAGNVYRKVNANEPITNLKAGVSNTVNGITQSETAQHLSNAAGNVAGAAKSVVGAGVNKLQDAKGSIDNYANQALAAKGLNANSSEEEKKAAIGEANLNAMTNFFGKLRDTVTQKIDAVTPATEPIAQVVNPTNVTRNIQEIREQARPKVSDQKHNYK